MALARPLARFARALVALPFLIPFVACGSSDATGAPAVSPSQVGTFAQFLDQAATLSCASQTPCCVAQGYEENEKCVDDVQKAGLGQSFDTRGNYSAEGGAKCLSAYASAASPSCGLSYTTPPAPKPFAPDPCNGIFRGPSFNSVPLGEKCVLNGDCISAGDNARTSCGSGNGSSSELRCRAVVTAYPGEACGEGFGTEVGKTFTCLSSAECVDSVCVAFPGAGEACTKSYRCAPGLTCRGGLKGDAGTCEAPAKLGDACTSGGVCADGLICDGVVCKARGKTGEACAGGGGGYDPYGGGCESGNYCDGVVCKAFAKTGEPCQSGTTCRSGSCSSKGRCEASPQTGGPGSVAPYCK